MSWKKQSGTVFGRCCQCEMVRTADDWQENGSGEYRCSICETEFEKPKAMFAVMIPKGAKLRTTKKAKKAKKKTKPSKRPKLEGATFEYTQGYEVVFAANRVTVQKDGVTIGHVTNRWEGRSPEDKGEVMMRHYKPRTTDATTVLGEVLRKKK